MHEHSMEGIEFNIVNVMAPPMPTYTNSDEVGFTKKKQVSLFKLYRYATPLDVLLMILGILAAIGSGIMIPVYVLSMGNIIDSFSYADIYAARFQ